VGSVSSRGLGKSHLEEGLGELIQLRGEGVFVVIQEAARAGICGGPLLILGEAREPASECSLIGERSGLDVEVPFGSCLEPKTRAWRVGLEGIAMAVVDSSFACLCYPKIDGNTEGYLG
jgi:hypothetical protein